MNNKLTAFILSWRWHFKKLGIRGYNLRKRVAEKFRESPEYKNKTWFSSDFIETWDKLKKERMI